MRIRRVWIHWYTTKSTVAPRQIACGKTWNPVFSNGTTVKKFVTCPHCKEKMP